MVLLNVVYSSHVHNILIYSVSLQILGTIVIHKTNTMELEYK